MHVIIRFVLTCAVIQLSEKYSRTLLCNTKPATKTGQDVFEKGQPEKQQVR